MFLIISEIYLFLFRTHVVYDPNKMNAIPASFLIDTVVTHIPHLHIVNYSPKTTLANGL